MRYPLDCFDGRTGGARPRWPRKRPPSCRRHATGVTGRAGTARTFGTGGDNRQRCRTIQTGLVLCAWLRGGEVFSLRGRLFRQETARIAQSGPAAAGGMARARGAADHLTPAAQVTGTARIAQCGPIAAGGMARVARTARFAQSRPAAAGERARGAPPTAAALWQGRGQRAGQRRSPGESGRPARAAITARWRPGPGGRAGGGVPAGHGLSPGMDRPIRTVAGGCAGRVCRAARPEVLQPAGRPDSGPDRERVAVGGRGRIAQHIAAAPDRLDVVVAAGGLGQLLAQLADEHVDDLELGLVHAAV
jgi:hypothetical protein